MHYQGLAFCGEAGGSHQGTIATTVHATADVVSLFFSGPGSAATIFSTGFTTETAFQRKQALSTVFDAVYSGGEATGDGAFGTIIVAGADNGCTASVKLERWRASTPGVANASSGTGPQTAPPCRDPRARGDSESARRTSTNPAAIEAPPHPIVRIKVTENCPYTGASNGHAADEAGSK
jgi:hypothetical protein